MTALFDICICTFRRTQLAETLQSIARLHVPSGWQIRVIIADNDDTPSAQQLVQTMAQETGLNITYLHAPARNISVARNACLDAATAPLVAFLDDDESATPDWLRALHSTLVETDADIVLGPVEAIGLESYPQWVQEDGFFATKPVWVDGQIITGYSCNVLFRRTIPALAHLRFRVDLGTSGGEDTVFFAQAHQAGARFAYAEKALVTEVLPAHRASLLWLLKRRFRSGQTHGLLLREAQTNHFKQLGIAAAKALFCLMMTLTFRRWRFWLLRASLHLGVIAQLLGARTLTQYGMEKAS